MQKKVEVNRGSWQHQSRRQSNMKKELGTSPCMKRRSERDVGRSGWGRKNYTKQTRKRVRRVADEKQKESFQQ